jgi:dienelactone hydrolase
MSLLLQLGGIRVPMVATAVLFFLAGLAADRARAAESVVPPLSPDLQKILSGTKAGDPARYQDVFAPLRTELAALSPDGRLLAYTVRTGEEIRLHIVSVDPADKAKPTTLLIARHDPEIINPYDRFPPVRWLRWISPRRLAYEVSEIETFVYWKLDSARGTGGWVQPTQIGSTISAVNADGSEASVLIASRKFIDPKQGRNDHATILAVGSAADRANMIVIEAWHRAVVGNRGNPSSISTSYAVDALSGKTTKISEEDVASPRFSLLDTWGRVRCTIERWRTSQFPQPFFRVPPEESARQDQTLDATTRLTGFVLSPDTFFKERSVPLGFDIRGDILYYASNVGRDTYGIYAMDLKTGRLLPGTLESARFDLYSPQCGTFDGPSYLTFPGIPRGGDYPIEEEQKRWLPSSLLVMDRFTHRLAGVRFETTTRTAVWLRPELQGVQDWLAANRPDRSAEILEWDEALNRVLVREQAPANAGGFYVLDRKAGTYRECARRGSDPEAGSITQVTPFAFTLANGSKIDGVLAMPRDPKVKRTPLVILCPDLPWQHQGAGYRPEFEALARMGFAVALYNGRGVWGTGNKERQKLAAGYEEVQAADIVAVADHLAENFPVSRKSVALFGRSHGGFVSLRALQLHPQRFCCAVTVDALIDPGAWFEAHPQARLVQGMIGDDTRLKASPLLGNPELIRAPVLTIVSRDTPEVINTNTRFHAAMQNTAPDSELVEIPNQQGLTPKELTRQWARTESFLNYVLYDYRVKLGETEYLPDKPAPVKQP